MREETRCCNMGYSFWLTARVILYASSHIQYTPVVEHWLEREIAQWVHYDGSICFMHHERMPLPWSYKCNKWPMRWLNMYSWILWHSIKQLYFFTGSLPHRCLDKESKGRWHFMWLCRFCSLIHLVYYTYIPRFLNKIFHIFLSFLNMSSNWRDQLFCLPWKEEENLFKDVSRTNQPLQIMLCVTAFI